VAELSCGVQGRVALEVLVRGRGVGVARVHIPAPRVGMPDISMRARETGSPRVFSTGPTM